MNLLTQEELKKHLRYDENTGLFCRLISTNRRIRVGDVVPKISKSTKYPVIQINKVQYYAHRLAWLYVTGSFPKHQIDHINGIKTDNRILNLREATNSQNQVNQFGEVKNKTGYKGVNERNGFFVAHGYLNNKKIYLGHFRKKEDAYEAHKKFVKENFGEYANV